MRSDTTKISNVAMDGPPAAVADEDAARAWPGL